MRSAGSESSSNQPLFSEHSAATVQRARKAVSCVSCTPTQTFDATAPPDGCKLRVFCLGEIDRDLKDLEKDVKVGVCVCVCLSKAPFPCLCVPLPDSFPTSGSSTTSA